MWLIFLLLLAAPGRAQVDRKPFELVLEKFCGNNDHVPSNKIPDCDSPDSENVLTDNGVLEKMPGMDTIIAAVNTGYPIRNTWAFTTSGNSKYLIAHSSVGIYYTDFSASPVLLNTVSNDYEVDAVAAFSKIYFTNRTTWPWTWDGVSTDTKKSDGQPLCTYYEFAHERIYCGNSDTSASAIHVSSYGSGSYWTVPADVDEEPDGPNLFYFSKGDGQSITCLKQTPWGIFVGKPNSTHILKGYNNDTYYKRVIDPVVGCTDDRLVQMLDGILIWLAKDGVYAWSGTGQVQRISDKISGTIDDVRTGQAFIDYYTVTSKSQWEEGNFSSNGPSDSWDTTITPGAIVPSSASQVLNSTTTFSAGTLTNLDVFADTGLRLAVSTYTVSFPGAATDPTDYWTCSEAGGATCDFNYPSGISGVYSTRFRDPSLTCLGTQGCECVYEILSTTGGVLVRNYPSDTGQYAVSSSLTEALVSSQVVVRIGIKHATEEAYATSGPFKLPLTLSVSVVKAPNAGTCDFYNVRGASYVASGSYTSPTFDTYFTTPTFGPINITMTQNATAPLTLQAQVSSDGSTWDSAVSISTGHIPAVSAKRYLRYVASFSTVIGTNTATISLSTMTAVSTGTYTSDVIYLGTEMTSWKSGDWEEDSAVSGRTTYQTRCDTETFAWDATDPPWVSQTNHQTVSASTGSYYQFRIISSIKSSSETVTIDAHTANWQEGSAIPGASIVDDHRYIMCVAATTQSVRNDSCEIWQKNKEWARITGVSIGGATIYDNYPVGCSGNTDSACWKMMQKDSLSYGADDIDARWRTKDFTMGSVNGDKTLREIWADAERQLGSTLKIGYSVDRSTDFTEKDIPLDTEDSYVNQQIPLDEGYSRGRYHAYEISQNSSTETFKVNALSIFGDIEPRY